jgi:ABC-type branched-subunit amino acid transport system substrate-binding protein
MTAAVFLFSGCGKQQQAFQAMDENNTIKIAVVGDAQFLETGGSMDAMNLAAEDFEQETGYHIEIETYDDESNYNKGVTLATEIANDPEIAVAISKQELDIIDTVASIFEEQKKPLIITNGCYDRTTKQGYQYLITDFINAQTAGQKMGEYAISKGYQNIAYCHSDTEYEKDELKGVERALKGSDTTLADIRIGPYSEEDFEEAYEEWTALGIDAVYISIYYLEYGSDIVRMLREKGSDIQVVTDYAMDNDTDIEKNGAYLDGTVIVPLYAYEENEAFKECDQRFSERYGYELTSFSLQSYELIRMLGAYLSSGITTSEQFMDLMKGDEGFSTISGTIRFHQDGTLAVTDEIPFLKFKGDAFLVEE